jgi:hypothetical protein
MKIPLKYQSTEYDCVPISFLNAFNYLFDREEIPPEVIKTIVSYSLNTFNHDGELGKKGTTWLAIRFICEWLNDYSEAKDFKVECITLTGSEVNMEGSKLAKCLNKDGVILSRILLHNARYHYVLITDVDDNNVYLFDPYYRKKKFEEEAIIILDNAFKANRKVCKSRFNSFEGEVYSLGPKSERECVLITRVH